MWENSVKYLRRHGVVVALKYRFESDEAVGLASHPNEPGIVLTIRNLKPGKRHWQRVEIYPGKTIGVLKGKSE